MATKVDTNLGRNSRFFNKRMRQVSSLIAVFGYQVYSLQFLLHYNDNLSFFQGFFFEVLLTLNSSRFINIKKKQRNLANIQPWTYY